MKRIICILSIIGLFLGIILGLLVPDFIVNFEFIGTIYINLLKFLIIPVVFTSIMVTVYKTKKGDGKTLIKTILLFALMFMISFLITSVIVWLLNPSKGFRFEEVAWHGDITSFNIQDIIINLFPTNIVTMIADNSIFACIMLAFISGIAASKVEGGEDVMKVVEGLKNIFYSILEYIMNLTPLATVSLIGSVVAKYHTSILGVGFKYIGVAYLSGIIVMLLVMILPVWIICKINPITYIKKVSKVWLMSITTCSSAATLPTTLKICNKEFGVPNKITNIVVPLGTTINMCGGAVSFALLGIFCSSLYGIDISLGTYVVMLLSATLINMAAPGIPNGGVLIGATYLSMLGIPLTFIGFYSAMYKLLDMAYTTLNVTGDVTANILIAKVKKKK